MSKNIKVKNTSKKAVLLSLDLGLALAPGEVMALSGELLKKALKVKGVVKTKEKPSKEKPSKKGK